MQMGVIEICVHARATNIGLQKDCQVSVARLATYIPGTVIQLLYFSKGFLKTFAKPVVWEDSSGKIVWR